MEEVVIPIDVRYQETDQMGVVYHANYLVWFEIARTKYVESRGLSYVEMEKQNIVWPGIDAHVRLKKPIRVGENPTVETWLNTYDGLRTTFGYNVVNEQGEIAVTGTTEHVFVKKDTFRPLSLRKVCPKWHEAYLNMLDRDGE